MLESYHRNGQLELKTYYIDGVEHDGRHLTYHSNGNVSTITSIKDGQTNGSRLGYWEDGTLWFDQNWKDGVKHGVNTTYLNGMAPIVKCYVNGGIRKMSYCAE